MAKLNWSKAKSFRGGSEAAYPGGHPRGDGGNVKTWDELERMANQEFPAPGVRRITAKEIEAAKTPKGAWTKHTLAGWGVPWPPPRGWKAALIAGVPIEQGAILKAAEREERASRDRESAKESLEAKLLRDVVLTLSSVGMAHLLAELPEVLAYFGGQTPSVADVIGCRPPPELITGAIALDDKVWSFSCVPATSQPSRERH